MDPPTIIWYRQKKKKHLFTHLCKPTANSRVPGLQCYGARSQGSMIPRFSGFQGPTVANLQFPGSGYVPTCWATAMLHIVDDSAANLSLGGVCKKTRTAKTKIQVKPKPKAKSQAKPQPEAKSQYRPENTGFQWWEGVSPDTCWKEFYFLFASMHGNPPVHVWESL